MKKKFEYNDRVQRRFPNGDVVKGRIVNTCTQFKDTVSVLWDNSNSDYWPAGYITSIYEIEKVEKK